MIIPVTDGIKTESAKEEKKNGDFVEKTITTDSSGQKVEETKSRTTNEDKSVTTTEGTKDEKGSTFLEKTEQPNKDYTQEYFEKDAEGNITKYEKEEKKTESNNFVTEIKDILDESDKKEETVISKDPSGDVKEASVKETDQSGKVTDPHYEGNGEGLTLSNVSTNGSELSIPSQIEGLAGQTFCVTEIGAGAIAGNTTLRTATFGSGIRKLAANAMKERLRLMFRDEKGMCIAPVSDCHFYHNP